MASTVENTYPTSPGLPGDNGRSTTDIPVEPLSCEGSTAMDDLPSPCVSSLEGGLEQFFRLPNASGTIPINLEILTDGESWNVSESLHTVQQAGDQSAQEIACAYPKAPPTFRAVTDCH
ncbi:hypothetical protein PHISCL_05802 [Aspergillus sclerotialis]|uniref:Uncharacterized protein n=1 Tax=Aspergillus sclerotialis TaxID=2070753 RepID=A0A3A2ZXS2_9EURO|nr:hypothetical protein PHISCL_05802 [Aspergillus sclerotialis]